MVIDLNSSSGFYFIPQLPCDLGEKLDIGQDILLTSKKYIMHLFQKKKKIKSKEEQSCFCLANLALIRIEWWRTWEDKQWPLFIHLTSWQHWVNQDWLISHYLFILIGGQWLYNIVVVFAIDWYELAMGVHVSPHPNPPPTSLPTPSLWVVPVHQLWVPFFMHRTWTGHLCHIWEYTCFHAISLKSSHPRLLPQIPALYQSLFIEHLSNIRHSAKPLSCTISLNRFYQVIIPFYKLRLGEVTLMYNYMASKCQNSVLNPGLYLSSPI